MITKIINALKSILGRTVIATDQVTYDQPVWVGLKKLKPEIDPSYFMFMHSVEVGSDPAFLIHGYKHTESRGYMFISDDGQCWQETEQGYERISLKRAKRYANYFEYSDSDIEGIA